MPKETDQEKTVIEKINDSADLSIDDDDYFEKILNEKVEIPDEEEEDEDGKTKIKDDNDKKNVVDNKDDKPTRTELEEQIATLEKEAQGRLNDTVKSRQERRIFKDELVELKGAVATLLNKKNPDEEKKETPKPLEEPIKKIEFGDDESAFVDLTEVKDAIHDMGEKTQVDLEKLKLAEMDRKVKEQYDRTVNEVISKDTERYTPAYEKLQTMINALNDRVIEMQDRTNNLGDKNGGLEIDAGLDLMDGTPEEKAFLKDFPGINPVFIARAFNSKRDFRNALDNVAESLKEKSDTKVNDKLNEDLIEKAKNKPGSLTNSDNKSGSTASLIDQIGELKTSDIMDIDDKTEAKLLKLMENEELRGD